MIIDSTNYLWILIAATVVMTEIIYIMVVRYSGTKSDFEGMDWFGMKFGMAILSLAVSGVVIAILKALALNITLKGLGIVVLVIVSIIGWFALNYLIGKKMVTMKKERRR